MCTKWPLFSTRHVLCIHVHLFCFFPYKAKISCHCDKCDQKTCETDGVCFSSVEQQRNGDLLYSYRYTHFFFDFVFYLPITWRRHLTTNFTFVLSCVPSCMSKLGMFPPGRSIWCNFGTSGPTTRPSSAMGGRLCCRNAHFCNSPDNPPQIIDYSTNPHLIFNKGDVEQFFFQFCFVLIFLLFGLKNIYNDIDL